MRIDDRSHLAFNDVSLHRRMGDRVAELSYLLDGEEVGSVRCDGIVVCTPAGSTGYNLANGGPVMAWGVEGFGVSFIAPHSLAARSLVVAPDDGLRILSRSEHAVDLSVDGRPGRLAGAGHGAARPLRPGCRSPGAAAGDVLLPQAAGEVRAPLPIGRAAGVTTLLRMGLIRRAPLLDHRACSTSSGSRTSC